MAEKRLENGPRPLGRDVVLAQTAFQEECGIISDRLLHAYPEFKDVLEDRAWTKQIP